MKYVKKIESCDLGTVNVGQRLDPEFPKSFPALFEYLTSDAWEDGKPRQRATLLLLIEDGSLKGCLNDRALERSLWATGASVGGVLLALERAVQSDSAEWRRSGAASYKKKR